MKITNISFDVQRLTGRDGTVHEIEPGASASVDLPDDDINVAAKVNARLIAVGEQSETKPKPAAKRAKTGD